MKAPFTIPNAYCGQCHHVLMQVDNPTLRTEELRRGKLRLACGNTECLQYHESFMAKVHTLDPWIPRASIPPVESP